MKVNWTPFDVKNKNTWPEHHQVVWVTDQFRVVLVQIDRSMSPDIFFDPLGADGIDVECAVDEYLATYWAPADLPELPQ